MTDLTRRELLPGMLSLGLGVGGALGPGSVAAAHHAMADAAPAWADDPAANLRNLVRMQGSLDEEDVRWWFNGVIFAVQGETQTPKPLFRFEGMEVYWFSHQRDGYFLGGNTVTFFRNLTTGRFLQQFANPITGETNTPKPSVQGGTLGFKYTTHGIWPARYSGEPLGPVPQQPLRLQWQTAGDQVWLQHQTVYPPGMPPLHGQQQSLFANRRDFDNRRIKSLSTVFSSTVFMGWFKWMNMAARPGHLVWHASGAKLGSIDDLPREYRERAEREYPQRMTAKPVGLATNS